jgi:hypothetical protein
MRSDGVHIIPTLDRINNKEEHSLSIPNFVVKGVISLNPIVMIFKLVN